uniref:DNA 3'-5' helicase n=1 Tax=Amphimedon queenslandica TaxID=400682 RepID=A0A1X7VSW8_AMPQE
MDSDQERKESSFAMSCVTRVAQNLDIVLNAQKMEAILAFMSGFDVFVSLETGYDESLIYGLLPMAFDLYKDQKSMFQQMGITTEFLGEDQFDSSAIKRVVSCSDQLVFISSKTTATHKTYKAVCRAFMLENAVLIGLAPNHDITFKTRASTKEMKEKTLSSVFSKNGKLRLLFATTALDCPDIRVIYHWGPPTTLEEYMQVSGRAGRDGQLSESILLYGNAGRFVDDMKEYAKNKTKCRREMLYKDVI